MKKIEIKVNDNTTFFCNEEGEWSVDDKAMPFLNGRLPEDDVIQTLLESKDSPEIKKALIAHFPMLGFHN